MHKYITWYSQRCSHVLSRTKFDIYYVYYASYLFIYLFVYWRQSIFVVLGLLSLYLIIFWKLTLFFMLEIHQKLFPFSSKDMKMT